MANPAKIPSPVLTVAQTDVEGDTLHVRFRLPPGKGKASESGKSIVMATIGRQPITLPDGAVGYLNLNVYKPA